MLLKLFYDERLAQASYLVGCAATGEAVVVDANRDVERYIDVADAQGMRITHVTETHIHADFVSGSRELAQRTGATLYLSDEGAPDWRYAFAEEAGAVLLRDGDGFDVGRIRIEAMRTPGHTPEHLSFLVTDTATADEPIGIFTGDFVFVGDVGRPDLLERAAGLVGTTEAGARALFDSLERFKRLPDYLQVWPGHGAGSACGRSLGAVPQSTVGYEKRFNWAMGYTDESAFVEAVLTGQPEPPKYFSEMKRINRVGPAILGGPRRPDRLPDERLAAILAGGALVLDTRPAAEFARGHVPGTLNIPLNRSFNTWAGWFVPYDRDFYLIVDEADASGLLDQAVRDLAMIGLDRIAGAFAGSAIDAWAAMGTDLERVGEVTTDVLAAKLATGELYVVDVRGRGEWEAGHLPGVPNIPLGSLPERISEIPVDRPVVVHCQAGGRAAIAASLLQTRGIKEVVNLKGGFGAWAADDRPVVRGERTAAG